MKQLKFSILLISKFKVNQTSPYITFFRPQNNVMHIYYRSFCDTNPCKLNLLFSNCGKLFEELKNQKNNQFIKKFPYFSSCFKYPHLSDNVCETKEASETLNVVNNFVKATPHNISQDLSHGDIKFADAVKEVSYELLYTSLKNVKKVLRYLCIWRSTSSTKANFKNLGNFLDQESVTDVKKSNNFFHRKTSNMSNKNRHVVFVYGTLKKDEPNHDLIEKSTEGVATFLGHAKTVKKWPLVIASRYNIPYLLYSEGRGMNVIGEIYEVDDIMLAKLDQLECHPEYYTRLLEEVQIISENEETLLKPWIYFLKNFRSQLLELPFLSDYSSKGSHGLEYVSRYTRPSGENYYSDVMNI